MQQAVRLQTAQCGGHIGPASAPGAGLAVVAGDSVLSRPRAQPPSEAGAHTAMRAVWATPWLLLPAATALLRRLIRLLLPLPSRAPAQHLRRQPRARALPARSLAAVRLHSLARVRGPPCCAGPGLRGGARVGALAGALLRVVARGAVLCMCRGALLARLLDSQCQHMLSITGSNIRSNLCVAQLLPVPPRPATTQPLKS